jgi:hypothetical protein
MEAALRRCPSTIGTLLDPVEAVRRRCPTVSAPNPQCDETVRFGGVMLCTRTGSLVDDVRTAPLVIATTRVLADGGADVSVGGSRCGS